MKQNDSRINAYRRAAGFQPEKISSDEVAKNNAAIEATLKKQTDEAIAALKAGKKQQSTSTSAESAASSFKPFSFADAPAFSSHQKEQPQTTARPAAEDKRRAKTQNSVPAKSTALSDRTPLAEKAASRSILENMRTNPSIINHTPQSDHETQFDFAAFAARNGNSAFQPKKFAAKPLEKIFKSDAEPQPAAKPQNSSAAKEPNPVKRTDDVLYKIPAKADSDNVCRRVAKFLLLIGVDEAAKVIAHLPQDQVDRIIPEIASIRSVPKDEAAVILAEFESLIEQAREGGGVGTARSILEKAFGSGRANEMLHKAVPFAEGKPFDYLKDLNGEKLSFLLKDESSPVRALVLSQVKPAVAAAVINGMNDIDRKETIQRLAKLSSFPPDILSRIDQTMREKVQTMQMPSGDSIDGRGALAAILRKMDSSSEKNILANLSVVDSELETDLRSRLFTIEDIKNADDRFLQDVLNGMDNPDIAVLICGKEESFRKKILSCVSKGRALAVLEEETARKPFSRKESDFVTNNFFAVMRKAWESGELIIHQRDEEEWIL